MRHFSRRSFLGAAGVATAGAVAGCSSGTGADDSTDAAGDVVVGPGGSYVYDPDEYTVTAGETVTWYFDSPAHNVGCVPDDNRQVSLPDDAEPFASYDEGSPGQTVQQGETYEHTFETPGEYTYVCIPHARQGMVGTVIVEE
ncbi:plastocyanin/azurin family copper-binding protein [Halosimplex salinum]|uniref:plastocyanin/azurin family copper-binding protein n=1 Tax=Halosimplex salinum TaxID=1710538 RepID=UPI000F49E47A|nr:plastocyanin/azurin family copper-binding protein [Halosimplex salinum]